MAIIKNSTNKNATEGVEKREPYYIVGGNVSWFSHYGEQYGGFLRKLKTELPYDTSISLLGKYLEKTIILKDTGTQTFIAALFTMAKTWKQLKCSLTGQFFCPC